MFFRQRAAANATLSYLFGCAGHQMAIAVDVVAGDEAWFIAEAERAEARIVHVIDTHVHPDAQIYPGPQAGSACGAGLSGKPASTIGFEKRFNPMLSMPRQDFVDALTAKISPPPTDMARIVEANLRGVDLPGIGWIVGVYGFTWGAAQFFTGKLSDRVGRHLLNAWGMQICGAGVALMPLGEGAAWWSASAAVAGLGIVAALGGRLETAFGFVAVAMLASGAVLFRRGEETHPGLNPAT